MAIQSRCVLGMSDVLVESITWLVSLSTGVGAQVVAVVAVAVIGLSMLTGHLPARRAALSILGCFIVFSAAGIAAALSSLVGNGQTWSATSDDETYAHTPSKPPEALRNDETFANLILGRLRAGQVSATGVLTGVSLPRLGLAGITSSRGAVATQPALSAAQSKVTQNSGQTCIFKFCF